MSVDKALEHTGQWWVCGKDGERFPGVLTLSPKDGPRLRVMGQFSTAQAPTMAVIPIIHGTTPACNCVTLGDCRLQGQAQRLGHGKSTEYGINLVLLGRRYPSRDAIQFASVAATYSTLENWVDAPVFDYPIGGDSNKITLAPPIAMDLCNTGGCSVHLDYGASVQTSAVGNVGKVTVSPGAQILFSFDKTTSFHQTAHVIAAMRDFLTFATWTATRVEEVRARGPSVIDPEVTILYRPFLAQGPQDEHAFSLFTLHEVQESIEQILGNWFAKGIDLQVIINLHLSGRYNLQMALENRFLAVSQALEAFHRRFRPGKELPDQQHSERVAAIQSAAPPEHHKWLQEQLKYSNELRLRQRLKRLFSESQEAMQYFQINSDKVIDDTCNTRNYLTHYDVALAQKALTGEGLLNLTFSLELLLDVCLLGELGIPLQVIAGLPLKKHIHLR